MTSPNFVGTKCWVCGSDGIKLVRPADRSASNYKVSVQITDSDYGNTAAIFQCPSCGFKQCPDMTEVISLYENMSDEIYVTSESPRRLQAHRLLERLRGYSRSGRLLDVGAGSGILVDEAKNMGYSAEGIDPSASLVGWADRKGRLVHQGTLPHADVVGKFDIVTLIDVIEHVANPIGMLCDIGSVLKGGGVGLLVTPDVGSIAARIVGRRWWHYRMAHIGYFNSSTINLALRRADLEPITMFRPKWYFTADYLWDRANVYLPQSMRLPAADFLKHFTVPLNLFDSLAVIFQRSNSSPRG